MAGRSDMGCLSIQPEDGQDPVCLVLQVSMPDMPKPVCSLNKLQILYSGQPFFHYLHEEHRTVDPMQSPDF